MPIPLFKQSGFRGSDSNSNQDGPSATIPNPGKIMELLNSFIITPNLLRTNSAIAIGAGASEVYIDANTGVRSTRGFFNFNSDLSIAQSSGNTAADDKQSQITFISGDLNAGEYTAFKIYYEKSNGPLWITDYSKSTYISMSAASNIAIKSIETGFTGQYYSNGVVSGTFTSTPTVNWDNGNVQFGAVSQNTTFAFTNGIAGGRYLLRILQDESGSRTYSWPASVKWPGGSVPTPSGAGKYDLFSFVFDGTRYFGGSNLNY